jgi:hypothetical protein
MADTDVIQPPDVDPAMTLQPPSDASDDNNLLDTRPYRPPQTVDPSIVQPIPNARPFHGDPRSLYQPLNIGPHGPTFGTPTRGDPRGMAPYIVETAKKYGIDPRTALAVARSEGLGRFYGDGGRSGGAFQLFTGGGVGNDFERDTGLNPLDPRNERATIDYALRRAAQGGWGPWHGAARVGIGQWQGINRQIPPTSRPQGYIANPYPVAPHEWGQPDHTLKMANDMDGLMPGPYMPQAGQISALIRQTMMNLNRFGSGAVSPLAIAQLRFYANYLIAQRKGQLEASKIQKEQADAHFDEVLKKQALELQAGNVCYSQFMPKADMQGFETCMQENEDSNYGTDKDLKKAVGDKDWAEIKRILDIRHNNWLTGSKVKSQKDKSEKQPAADPWSDQPQTQSPDSGGGTSVLPSPPASPSPIQPSQPETARPPLPSPGAVPTATGAAGATAGATNARQDELTNAVGMGTELPTDVTKQEVNAATARAADQLAAIRQQVLANPNLRPEQIVPAVSAINPAWGQDLRNRLDFGPAGTRSGSAGGPRAADYNSIMDRLATLADPNYTRGRGANQTDFNKDGSFSQRLFVRAAGLDAAAVKVNQDLQDLYAQKDPYGSPLINRLAGTIEQAAGDPRFAKLANDWRTYQTDLEALNNLGRPTVTGQRERTEITPWYTNAAGFRAQMSSDSYIAANRIDQQQEVFKTTLGGRSTKRIDPQFFNGLYANGTATGLTPSMVWRLHNIGNMNPDGTIRGSQRYRGAAPVVGQRYNIKGKDWIFTAGGNPRDLNDSANWEPY